LVVVVVITDVKIKGISKIPKYFSFFFQQKAIFFLGLVFSAFNLRMEEAQIINPFGYLSATKVLDENRKPVDWWHQYLDFNDPVAENEFYILFGDGLLVKKGKSKFKTSQYVKGEKYLDFKTFYHRAKSEKDSSDAWVLYGDNLPY
jgi:hypothetical protein